MGKTKIQWSDMTWPVVTGCSHAGSQGCDLCYAARMAATRLKHHPRYEGLATIKNGKARWTGEVRLNHDVLEQPLRWRKPRRVFVASMGDLFHDKVPFEFVLDVWRTMWQAEQHCFQILTKRPSRMLDFLEHLAGDTRDGKPHLFGTVKVANSLRLTLPNVHLGVSVENQAAADERIPLLLQTPAAVRFVSYEPALGPVDLSPQHAGDTVFAPLGEERFIDCGGCVGTPGSAARAGGLQPMCPGHEAGGIDWVICGGESGPGARPMHPDWARSLRDQCQAAGISYFFKAWGSARLDVLEARHWLSAGWNPNEYRRGHLLDGRTWQQFPAADGAGT